jgi:hypothetical protein
MAVNEGEALEVPRRLANAQITVDRTPVIFGQSGEPFTLGPNTAVQAPEIVSLSAEVRVETRGALDGGVLLVCEQFSSEAPDVQIKSYGPSRLELATGAELTYPWAQYVVPRPESVGRDDGEVAAALADLAKLVNRFSSSGYGGLGTHARYLDAAAGKGRVSRALLDYSLQRGLITKEGGLYQLHPEQFGLSFQQVKARVPSDSVRRFLQEYSSAST